MRSPCRKVSGCRSPILARRPIYPTAPASNGSRPTTLVTIRLFAEVAADLAKHRDPLHPTDNPRRALVQARWRCMSSLALLREQEYNRFTLRRCPSAGDTEAHSGESLPAAAL